MPVSRVRFDSAAQWNPTSAPSRLTQKGQFGLYGRDVIRFALKSLAGRKLRSVLTALAIVLGVAMMSGSYVLTDTIDKAFDAIFVDSYAGTDAVVTGKDPGFSFEGESAEAPPIPEETLERVRAVEGVEIATGSVSDFQTKLLRPDGEEIDTGGAPSLAFGIDTAPEFDRFNPLNLVEGRWPNGSGEVVVDEGVADDEELGLGDRIGVAALGPAQEFELVGIAKYGELSSIGGTVFAIFDVPTAQRLLDKEGQLDSVQAAAADGTTPEQLTQRIQAALGDDFTVRSGVEQADEESSEIATFTTIIPLLPALVRRDRPLRRRVRHLQHALDHGRAADARVRDACARSAPRGGRCCAR